MNKSLKYLLSLFLVFTMIVNDCMIGFQSKSADYYQSSFVTLKTELDLRNSRLYKFIQFVSRIKTSFSIPVKFIQFVAVFSFQIGVILKTRTFLHQKTNSFIRQFIFINEVITSGNYYKSLYNA